MKKLFHYGTRKRGASWPALLWVSSGYDYTRKVPFLNITLLGRFVKRLYAKEMA